MSFEIDKFFNSRRGGAYLIGEMYWLSKQYRLASSLEKGPAPF